MSKAQQTLLVLSGEVLLECRYFEKRGGGGTEDECGTVEWGQMKK
jgi:hypothetical protein